MSIAVRLGAFAAALVAVFAAAALAGSATHATAHDSGRHASAHHPEGMSMSSSNQAMDHAGHADALPGGLAIASGGYRVDTTNARLAPGRAGRFGFRVLGPDGRAVLAFSEEHGALLHLIVVRRDLQGFQHLHPTLAADGSWSTPLTLPAAGAYRVFADFQPRGALAMTLGTDLLSAGDFQPVALPAASRSAETNGYRVTLNAGRPRAGQAGELVFHVAHSGRPVTALEPYLGARGHLVALRQGDLAYLPVHPLDTQAQGDEIVFHALFPSPGIYRLFLQFRAAGQVHTAAYTLELSP